MKELTDGNEVPDRIYYYLLDWNDENQWDYMFKSFNKNILYNLNLNEFKQLFLHASSEDYKYL